MSSHPVPERYCRSVSTDDCAQSAAEEHPQRDGQEDAHGHEPFDKIDGAAQKRGGRDDGDRRRMGVLFFEPRALQNGHGEHAPSPAQQPVDGADTRSPQKIGFDALLFHVPLPRRTAAVFPQFAPA